MEFSGTEAVCDRCIEESSLAAHIEVNATLGYCTFCRRRSKKRAFAVPLEELLDHIRERVECEYEDAANSVGYESAEGGYQLPTMSSYELLEEVGLYVENEELRDVRIPAKIATHSGGIVARHSGIIVATHSGASLPRIGA